MKIGHQIESVSKTLTLVNTDGWSWRNLSFKLTRGGHRMLDYDRGKKRMLLETFPSIEGIFTKTDAAGTSFGDRDYQYKVVKVEGLVHKQDFGDQKVFLSPETDTLFLVDDQGIYECKNTLHELDSNSSL